jgi:fibronectin type 3 domain-containing protein
MKALLSATIALAFGTAVILGSCSLLFPDKDTRAPTVRITSPADGEAVSGVVAISASASDDVSVFKVVFYVDGGLLSEDASAPYSASWDTTQTGTGFHTISASAYDDSGNRGDSTAISVTTGGGSSTGTLLSKDFENLAAGTDWSRWNDSSLLAGAINANGGTVASALATANDPLGAGKGIVAHLQDSSAPGESATIMAKFAEAAKGELAVDLDIASEGTDLYINFGHLTGESTTTAASWVEIQKQSDGTSCIFAIDANGWMFSGGAIARGAWRTLRFSFDAGAKKFNIYSNSTLVLADQAFISQNVSTINYFSISGAMDSNGVGYGADVYLDGISAKGATADSFAAQLVAPTKLTASDGEYSDGVLLQWSRISGAAAYRVYRSASSGGTYAALSDDTDKYYYADYTAAGGTHYWYKVAAIDSASGAGIMSAADEGYASTTVTAPLAPTGVSASDGTSAGFVYVYWASVSGATSYDVYRAASANGSYALVGNSTSSPYYDGAATPGTIFYYKVVAKSSSTGLSSDYSASDSGYMKLSIPGGLSASDGTYAGYTYLSWSGVSGAASYSVYRAANSGGTYSFLASVTGITYSDTSAAAGTTYYYIVRAYSSSSSSFSSDSKSDSGYSMPPS